MNFFIFSKTTHSFSSETENVQISLQCMKWNSELRNKEGYKKIILNRKLKPTGPKNRKFVNSLHTYRKRQATHQNTQDRNETKRVKQTLHSLCAKNKTKPLLLLLSKTWKTLFFLKQLNESSVKNQTNSQFQLCHKLSIMSNKK